MLQAYTQECAQLRPITISSVKILGIIATTHILFNQIKLNLNDSLTHYSTVIYTPYIACSIAPLGLIKFLCHWQDVL